MNDEDVYRTAPATQGLLIKERSFVLYFVTTFFLGNVTYFDILYQKSICINLPDLAKSPLRHTNMAWKPIYHKMFPFCNFSFVWQQKILTFVIFLVTSHNSKHILHLSLKSDIFIYIYPLQYPDVYVLCCPYLCCPLAKHFWMFFFQQPSKKRQEFQKC